MSEWNEETAQRLEKLAQGWMLGGESSEAYNFDRSVQSLVVLLEQVASEAVQRERERIEGLVVNEEACFGRSEPATRRAAYERLQRRIKGGE